MQKFIFILSLSFPFTASLASSLNLGSFEHTASFSSSQNIYRDVVSYEPYETTCTRQVADGTETRCRTVYENHCTKVPKVGDVCEKEPISLCEEETVYTTETYDCIQYKKVVDTVYDHYVKADVEVSKTLRGLNYDLKNCQLWVNLTDTSEEFRASCLSSIVKLNVTERKEVNVSGNKERKIKIDLDFFSIEELNALKLGLNDFEYSKGMVSFKTADLNESQNYVLTFEVLKNRFLIKDKKLLEKKVSPTDLTSVEVRPDLFKHSFELKKWLAEFNPAKKHTLIVKLKALNPVDLKRAINYPALSNELDQKIIVNE